MAGKPLTAEAIALTEKKMDMSLDDIIKMGKINPSKAKKQRKFPNRSLKLPNNPAQGKSTKLKRFTDSRSSVRQGVVARKRSCFLQNQFPLTAEVAQKAAVSTFLNGNRGRFSGWTTPRNGVAPSQGRPPSAAFIAKLSQPSSKKQLQEANDVSKQWPQTLDSLFANMKEQRMRTWSRQNDNLQGHSAVSRRPPWSRDRFGY